MKVWRKEKEHGLFEVQKGIKYGYNLDYEREGDQSDAEEVKKTLLLRTLSASYLFGLLYRAVGSLSRVLNKVYKSVF